MTEQTIADIIDLEAKQAAPTVLTADGKILSIDDDGCYVDENGEVIPVEALGSLEIPDHLQSLHNPWAIESRNQFNFALDKRGDIEAKILAIKARAKAQALLFAKQIKAEEQRLAYWDFRWANAVIDFARCNLPPRRKTYVGDTGQVSFRNRPAEIEIIDEEAALKWMKQWAPDYVKKREWVNVTDVEATRDMLIGEGVETTCLFIKDIPARENVPKISTEVK